MFVPYIYMNLVLTAKPFANPHLCAFSFERFAVAQHRERVDYNSKMKDGRSCKNFLWSVFTIVLNCSDQIMETDQQTLILRHTNTRFILAKSLFMQALCDTSATKCFPWNLKYRFVWIFYWFNYDGSVQIS